MNGSTGMRDVLRQVWRITKPYWVSEEKWWAWGLLIVVIALNLGTVALSVAFNYWRNTFYNTLQDLNEHGFYVQVAIFSGLAVIWVVVGLSRDFLAQMLRIRWRRWLTHRYLDRWLDHRAYYRLQLTASATDNPDQRISEDLRDITDFTLTLTLGLLRTVVSLFSFVFILWSLSGPITIPLGSLGEVTIPAYMVWAALVYATLGTIVTLKLGRPMVNLTFMQQRYEADFRYSLVRFRENTESVAFYRGEPRELEIFGARFGSVVANFWAIMWRQLKVNSFVFGTGQASVVFPYLMQAPRFFAKQIQLGDLMQTAEAFGQVLDALSWIINTYTDTNPANANIAGWQAIIRRLSGFEQHVETLAEEAKMPSKLEIAQRGSGLSVSDLDLDLPDGKPLISDVELRADAGDALLVSGPTGVGKSTVLRAIAGLWPFGRGKVRLPAGRVFFVPQKPYVPLGTLRQALAYPESGSNIPEDKLRAALTRVGLGAFASELDVTDQWAQRFSGGEQQRLAFARVLLAEPALIFLDEATSALDESSEAELYRMLREAPWRPTIVSVGHRSTLRAFHETLLVLAPMRRAAPAAS
jgi:vitamin B12/bleomycin/antimicrobial peptide transport system ATP-binding/permease protein